METTEYDFRDYILVKPTEKGYDKMCEINKKWVKENPHIVIHNIATEKEHFKSMSNKDGYIRMMAWDFIKEYGGLFGMDLDTYFEVKFKMEPCLYKKE